jgi:aminomethyltransferase
MSELRHSPLESAHLSLGARMVPFAGWNMPVQYSSIIDEHQAVRQKVGIFDISHMGQVFVSGPDALDQLNRLLTNDLAKLAVGEGQYTIMLNEKGGVIDDLIAYRNATEEYFLVINASKIDEDVAWLSSHLGNGAIMRNESDQWAGMAIQGPHTTEIFSQVFPSETLPARNGITTLANGSIVCRTGYTGEDGFEFFCPAADGIAFWEKFIAAGAAPCGLGARDTLRLEMGFPLNGNDLSLERTPIEAGLGFFCDLQKSAFTGREILARQKSDGPQLKLTAVRCTEKSPPPRAHYPVLDANGHTIGELSSGALSPSLSIGIGMAYLPAEYSKIGTRLQIQVRDRAFPVEVVKKPFYQPATKA